MMKLKQFLIVVLFLSFVTACDKDDNESKESKETAVILEKTSISAKWNISNSSEYKSFEFNESGNYILVKDRITKSTGSNIILFGTYELSGDKDIILSDLGTIKVSNISDSSISFSLLLDSSSENEISIQASKQKEIQSTVNNELLCRTWRMLTVNAKPVAGTEDEFTVLFSKAGTYFISSSLGVNALAQWKWSNAAETTFLYSWDQKKTWSDVEIVELTGSSLKILEKFDDEGDDLSVLVPVIN